MYVLLRAMECVILQILWICHVIYDALMARKDKKATTLQEDTPMIQDGDNKRHFIHLYTTTSLSGKPLCYMDVYQMSSALEEQQLRDACSGGVPNKTYLKYIRESQNENCVPETWLEYSTIAI